MLTEGAPDPIQPGYDMDSPPDKGSHTLGHNTLGHSTVGHNMGHNTIGHNPMSQSTLYSDTLPHSQSYLESMTRYPYMDKKMRSYSTLPYSDMMYTLPLNGTEEGFDPAELDLLQDDPDPVSNGNKVSKGN